jgi:hypothetical protein
MRNAVAARKSGVDRVGAKSVTACRSRSSVRTTPFNDKRITVTFVWQTGMSGATCEGLAYASIVLLTESSSRSLHQRSRPCNCRMRPGRVSDFTALDNSRARCPNRKAKHRPERSPSHRALCELFDFWLQICGGREAPLMNKHEDFALVTGAVFFRSGVAPWK